MSKIKSKLAREMDGRGEVMRRNHPGSSTATERIIQEKTWYRLQWWEEEGPRRKGKKRGRDKGDKGGPVEARNTHGHTYTGEEKNTDIKKNT